MTDDERVLYEHAEQVRNFGGRIDSPRRSQIEALGNSQLGSVKSIPTSGADPISPAPLTLAEMIVAEPIAVDVAFYYPNLFAGATIGTVFAGQPPGPISVGDGYVQITWSVKGGPVNVARIDGALGWRYPFVASQLLVEYIPVDIESTGGRIIAPNQLRDLLVSGTIVPASGAPTMPLTKTLFYPNLSVGESSQQPTPAWATEFRPFAAMNTATTMSVQIFGQFPPQQFGGSVPTDGLAGGRPLWTDFETWRPVGQGAVVCSIAVELLSVLGVFNPSVQFRLAL